MRALYPESWAVQNVGYWCGRVSRVMRGQLDARLEPLGLNFSEAQILLELNGHRSRSISELSRGSGQTHPSILKQVDRLIQAGLVADSAPVADRRVRSVELTDTARPLVQEIRDIVVAVNREALQGFPAGAQEQMLTYLQVIFGNLTIAHNQPSGQHAPRIVGLPSTPRTSK